MVNILLVQFRSDISATHEKNCFFRYFKKKRDLRLKIVSAFDKKIDFSNPQKLLREVQGVILGGSGQLYFSKKGKVFQVILQRISPFINYLLRNDFPSLGICFGHQILGYFLGGKVINDKNQAQTGTYLVSLTNQGRASHLFLNLPSKFLTQFGHQDSLKSLPPGAKLLAKTRKCKIAAFKYKNNIYGVQFHPELTYRDIRQRLKIYPRYTQDFKKIKLKSTPFSSKIIKNFLSKIIPLKMKRG